MLVEWTFKEGYNCWPGHGAQDMDKTPIEGVTSVAACKARCEAAAKCEGVIVTRKKTDGSGTHVIQDSACYRKMAVDLNACSADGTYAVADMYVMRRAYPAPPPMPPSPPLPPRLPPAKSLDLVKKLNDRFHAGEPSNDLTTAGLLIHQFDSRDDANPDGQPWAPTTNAISAAIINGRLQPEQDRGNVPLYSYSLAGLILTPEYNQVRCSYAYDTGSIQWNGACNSYRCADTESVDIHAQRGCAFNPTGLQRMMEAQLELRRRGMKPQFKVWDDHKFYNEVIIEDRVFAQNLPKSITAVFYLPTACDDIYDGPKCEAYARGAHRNMLRHFKLTEAQLPLVKFDYFDWDQPFEVMANCDPQASGVFSCGPDASAAPFDPSFRLAAAKTLVTPTCCWNQWGDATQCGDYPQGQAGGKCNADWSMACTANEACPASIPARRDL